MWYMWISPLLFISLFFPLTVSLSRKRWDFGVQRYRALCNMLSHGRICSAVTSKTSVVSPAVPDSNIPNSTEDPYSTQWCVCVQWMSNGLRHFQSSREHGCKATYVLHVCVWQILTLTTLQDACRCKCVSVCVCVHSTLLFTVTLH